ncbi:hypothetical protein [Nocardia sp. SC052]|uniref:MFS transporter n=1 Tax=Nocardia sichangensis TaxID=3385975 RepID=UPI00399F842A
MSDPDIPELPAWLLRWLIGHSPVAKINAMRRAADAHVRAAEALTEKLHRLHSLETGAAAAAFEGRVGDEVPKQVRDRVTEMQAQIDHENHLAKFLYENANTLQLEQYIVKGIAIALAAQLPAVVFPPTAAADRMAAETAALLARRSTLIVLAARSAALGALTMGTTVGLAEYKQIRDGHGHPGHRTSMDMGKVLLAAAAGGAGGLIGAPVAHVVMPALAPATGRVLATLIASAAGGAAGGAAGAGVQALITGEKANLAEMVLMGIGGGLFGGSAAALRTGRAGLSAADIRAASDPRVRSAPRLATPDSGDGRIPRPSELHPGNISEINKVPRRLAGEVLPGAERDAVTVFSDNGRDNTAGPGGPRRLSRAELRGFADAEAAEPSDLQLIADAEAMQNLTGSHGAADSPIRSELSNSPNQSPSSGGTRGSGGPRTWRAWDAVSELIGRSPGSVGQDGPASVVSAPGSGRPTDSVPPVGETGVAQSRATVMAPHVDAPPRTSPHLGDPVTTDAGAQAPAEPGRGGHPAPAADGGASHGSGRGAAGGTGAPGDGGRYTTETPGSLIDSPQPAGSGRDSPDTRGGPSMSADGADGYASSPDIAAGRRNCGVEAEAHANEITGYDGGDPRAINRHQAATEGVSYDQLARATGGDWRKGGAPSLRAVVDEVHQHGGVAITGVQFKNVGGHAVVFSRNDGQVLMHERIGNRVHERQGNIEESWAVDADGRRVPGTHRVEVHDSNAVDSWLRQLDPHVDSVGLIRFHEAEPGSAMRPEVEPQRGQSQARSGTDAPENMGYRTAILERESTPGTADRYPSRQTNAEEPPLDLLDTFETQFREHIDHLDSRSEPSPTRGKPPTLDAATRTEGTPPAERRLDGSPELVSHDLTSTPARTAAPPESSRPSSDVAPISANATLEADVPISPTHQPPSASSPTSSQPGAVTNLRTSSVSSRDAVAATGPLADYGTSLTYPITPAAVGAAGIPPAPDPAAQSNHPVGPAIPAGAFTLAGKQPGNDEVQQRPPDFTPPLPADATPHVPITVQDPHRTPEHPTNDEGPEEYQQPPATEILIPGAPKASGEPPHDAIEIVPHTKHPALPKQPNALPPAYTPPIAADPEGPRGHHNDRHRPLPIPDSAPFPRHDAAPTTGLSAAGELPKELPLRTPYAIHPDPEAPKAPQPPQLHPDNLAYIFDDSGIPAVEKVPRTQLDQQEPKPKRPEPILPMPTMQASADAGGANPLRKKQSGQAPPSLPNPTGAHPEDPQSGARPGEAPPGSGVAIGPACNYVVDETRRLLEAALVSGSQDAAAGTALEVAGRLSGHYANLYARGSDAITITGPSFAITREDVWDGTEVSTGDRRILFNISEDCDRLGLLDAAAALGDTKLYVEMLGLDIKPDMDRDSAEGMGRANAHLVMSEFWADEIKSTVYSIVEEMIRHGIEPGARAALLCTMVMVNDQDNYGDQAEIIRISLRVWDAGEPPDLRMNALCKPDLTRLGLRAIDTGATTNPGSYDIWAALEIDSAIVNFGLFPSADQLANWPLNTLSFPAAAGKPANRTPHRPNTPSTAIEPPQPSATNTIEPRPTPWGARPSLLDGVLDNGRTTEFVDVAVDRAGGRRDRGAAPWVFNRFGGDAPGPDRPRHAGEQQIPSTGMHGNAQSATPEENDREPTPQADERSDRPNSKADQAAQPSPGPDAVPETPSTTIPESAARAEAPNPPQRKTAMGKDDGLLNMFRTDRLFRYHAIGQLSTRIGTGVGSYAAMLYVLEQGGPTAAGAIHLISNLPALFGAPFFAYFADHHRLKRMLMISQFGGGVAALTAGIAIMSGTPYIIPIMGATALVDGSSAMLFATSTQKVMKQIVGNDESRLDGWGRYKNFESWTVKTAGQATGPSALSATPGLPWLINGASFGLNLAIVSRLPEFPTTPKPDGVNAFTRVRRSLAEAPPVIRNDRLLRRSHRNAAITSFYSGAQPLYLLSMINDSNIPPWQAGALLVIGPTGVLIGNAIPRKWLTKLGTNAALTTRLVGVAGSAAVLASTTSPWVATAGSVFLYAVQGATSRPINTYQELAVPWKVSARVRSFLTMKTTASFALGGLIVGALSETTGAGPASWSTAAAFGAIAAGSLVQLLRRPKLLDCINAQVVWALGLETGKNSRSHHKEWKHLRNAIATQLVKIHLGPDTADPLGHIIDDVQNLKDGADTAVILVNCGKEWLCHTATNTDGRKGGHIVIFSTNITNPANNLNSPDRIPRVRTRDKWKQSDPVDIKEAYVAFLTTPVAHHTTDDGNPTKVTNLYPEQPNQPLPRKRGKVQGPPQNGPHHHRPSNHSELENLSTVGDTRPASLGPTTTPTSRDEHPTPEGPPSTSGIVERSEQHRPTSDPVGLSADSPNTGMGATAPPRRAQQPNHPEFRAALCAALAETAGHPNIRELLAAATAPQLQAALGLILPDQLSILRHLQAGRPADHIVQQLSRGWDEVIELANQAADEVGESLVHGSAEYQRFAALSEAMSQATPWMVRDALEQLGTDQKTIVVGLFSEGKRLTDMAAVVPFAESAIELMAHGAVRRMADHIAGKRGLPLEPAAAVAAESEPDGNMFQRGSRPTESERKAAAFGRIDGASELLIDLLCRLNELLPIRGPASSHGSEGSS